MEGAHSSEAVNLRNPRLEDSARTTSGGRDAGCRRVPSPHDRWSARSLGPFGPGRAPRWEVAVGIVAWIVLGAIAGWITNLIMGGGEGVIATIILGIVGAVVGGFPRRDRPEGGRCDGHQHRKHHRRSRGCRDRRRRVSVLHASTYRRLTSRDQSIWPGEADRGHATGWRRRPQHHHRRPIVQAESPA